MNNLIKFVGNLANMQVTPYTNRDGQSHSRVDFELVSDERISQQLRLKIMGSIGDQMAALDPKPGFSSVVAYIEFHTFSYQERVCQEIRVWKLEVTMADTGMMYTITNKNAKTQNN